MKILFLITGLGVGGAERQLLDISDRLVERGHEVRICYLTGVNQTLPSHESIRVFGLGMKKTILGFGKAYLYLRRQLAEFRPDVLHSHMVHANLIARLLRLTTRIPKLICTAHSNNEGGKLRMWAYRITDSLADLSTNVSADAVAAFVAQGAVAPGRMIAVANGIDTERFVVDRLAGEAVRRQMGVESDVTIILAVGRLTEAKDYPNLLNAYGTLENAVGKTQLWIVGEGELCSELQNLTVTLGLADRVRFLGMRRDIPALLNAASVFVLSSAWEGFGLVVAEAMACRKVVVATDCGGVREVLGDCGLLVPPRNSGALALALGQALGLPHEEAVSMGVRARQRVVSNYELDRVVENWLGIYAGDIKSLMQP